VGWIRQEGNVKILVTGATGYTGKALALNLAAEGHHVRALARSTSKVEDLQKAGIEVVIGDIACRDEVFRAVEGMDRIYHVAALYRQTNVPDHAFGDVHVKGTENICEAVLYFGVKKVVHTSTIGVHGHVENPPGDEDSPFNPGDLYQQTKLEGELLALRYAKEKKLPLSVVRPAGIYGPGETRMLKLFRAVKRRRFVMIGNGETCCHFVYIDDLIQGFKLAAESPNAVGRSYIIAGDEYVTLNRLVALIAEAVGVPTPRWRIPYAPVYAAGAICEALCKPFGMEPPLHRRRVAFFDKTRAFCNERARQELGYRPQIDLRTGVRRTAEWYLKHQLL
jgi:nucleoside-diphosphate-sugar epimerase